PAASPPPPTPAPSKPGEAGVLGGKRPRQEKKNEFQASESAMQAVEVTGSSAAVLDASMLQASGPRILPVPGTKVLWKIDDDGRVRRTSDLGENWKLQDTGVNATLLSGAATSEAVCWLVGRFGTVLLTTDSGAHWTKLTVPINSTIDRIEA